jgi:hypothetical protein
MQNNWSKSNQNDYFNDLMKKASVLLLEHNEPSSS